jgi:hypothetical protein
MSEHIQHNNICFCLKKIKQSKYFPLWIIFIVINSIQIFYTQNLLFETQLLLLFFFVIWEAVIS